MKKFLISSVLLSILFVPISIIFANTKKIDEHKANRAVVYLSGNESAFVNLIQTSFIIQNTDNIINGSAFFVGTVLLVDLYASVIWNMTGIMKNDIILNGGTCILSKDLLFTSGNLMTSGIVNLNGKSLYLGYYQAVFNDMLLFEGIKGIIALRRNIVINNTWTIQNTVTINGNGYGIMFGDLGEIVVAQGSCLILKNISIDDQDKIRTIFDGKVVYE